MLRQSPLLPPLGRSLYGFADARSIGRPRPRKRFFSYEHADEKITDPQNNFKVNFYFHLFDVAITKLNERFELLSAHNDSFAFLQNIDKWKKLEAGQKRAVCLKLQQKLTSESGAADIDGEDLFHELELLPIVFNRDTTPLEVFNYIYSNNLTSVFPNLSISLRIYLTVPVTVAEGERSFSKLKLIKNYLRSTMSQERLSNLAMLSIEKEVAIDTSDLIKCFAHRKARKVDFFGTLANKQKQNNVVVLYT
ncbi:hypothetical protein JRQ81_015131 [Phrynocephalus forsythii]|uniref:HAT C-terminal dimerisation domain-containing protein n=1 Tax=Phrynocephalus forsythii TaxID=171643 RepID=A0A9Q0XYZ4_9SAUR|nr:hypothetical protein JRQ81_015131 [Phrynocephalus forsythii]